MARSSDKQVAMKLRIGITFFCFDECISGVEHYCLGLLDATVQLVPSNGCIGFTNRPDLVLACVGPSLALVLVKAEYIGTRAARVVYEHLRLPRLAERYEHSDLRTQGGKVPT